MIRITITPETCNGYGNCVRAAEAIFDIDDQGLVTLKTALVDDDQLERVRRAAYDCPTDSISFCEE